MVMRDYADVEVRERENRLVVVLEAAGAMAFTLAGVGVAVLIIQAVLQ